MDRRQKQNQLTGRQKSLSLPDIGEQIQQALYFQQTGFLHNAETIYKEILKSFPQQPDCLHFLGMLYSQQNKNELALDCIKKSIQLNIANPTYYSNYGLVLTKQNKLQEAEQAYRKAIDLQPDYAEAWFNLGVVCFQQDNLKESEKAYKRAIANRPDYIKALFNLASVQDLLGKQDEATRTFETILKINPASPEAHNTLAAVFFKKGGNDNLRKAEYHFWAALKIKPDYLPAYLGLGLLFEVGNNIESAIKCYSKILEQEPTHIEAMRHLVYALIYDDQISNAQDYISQILDKDPVDGEVYVCLGEINTRQGQFLMAEKNFNKAISINQDTPGAYWGLSRCRKYKKSDNNFIDKITDLISHSKKNKNQYLYFALGKIYNDIGDYDQAFANYQTGNEIRNKTIIYDADENSNFTNKIINTFTDELIHELQAGGSQSEIPVFVLGTPRSGTTLAEQIISSHSLVHGAGELKYITQQINQLKHYANNSKIYPEIIKALNKSDIKNMSNNYLDKVILKCTGENILRITDKMPNNFLHIGFIMMLFPNARIIHCKRHPLDSCLSIYFTMFVNQHRYSFDLKNIGHWYKDYLHLMEHWNKLFGDKILTIEYDDTVNNLEGTAKKMIDFCGLEWDENCLDYHQAQRDVSTASLWQVRQPVYKTSLDRWKRYDKHIGPLKEILAGYY